MVVSDSVVKRRVAVFIDSVNLESIVDEEFTDRIGAILNWNVKKRVAKLIFDFSALMIACHELLYHFKIFIFDCFKHSKLMFPVFIIFFISDTQSHTTISIF